MLAAVRKTCCIPYSHTLLNICRRNTFTQVDNKLGDLLDIDNVFGLVRVIVALDDLRATRHLKRLFFRHPLLICSNIPKVRRSETGIRFLEELSILVPTELEPGTKVP